MSWFKQLRNVLRVAENLGISDNPIPAWGAAPEVIERIAVLNREAGDHRVCGPDVSRVNNDEIALVLLRSAADEFRLILERSAGAGPT
jgi:hypothetical protein